jgi:hypothetical protein
MVRRNELGWSLWVKLLAALGAQTLAVVYFFGATVAQLQTELAWVRQRQGENFLEHERARVVTEKLYADFVGHCVRQEREFAEAKLSHGRETEERKQ